MDSQTWMKQQSSNKKVSKNTCFVSHFLFGHTTYGYAMLALSRCIVSRSRSNCLFFALSSRRPLITTILLSISSSCEMSTRFEHCGSILTSSALSSSKLAFTLSRRLFSRNLLRSGLLMRDNSVSDGKASSWPRFKFFNPCEFPKTNVKESSNQV